MPYRLLLPATLDLVPADVDAALKPFGATPYNDRGCAWSLPGGGAPGVADDAAPVIVRLLPVKALSVHPDEPRFSIPKGTQRVVEIIVPSDEPRPADCRRVHDCATAVAQELSLGVLNPYRGVYSPSAAAYCKGMAASPESDAVRVRCMTNRTDRQDEGRTRPARVEVKRPAPASAPTAEPESMGVITRMLMRLRGTTRHRLNLPAGCDEAYVRTMVRQIRGALPVARVSLDKRGRTIVIDAPDTPLVSRTVADLIGRYGSANPQAIEVSLAYS